MAIEPRQPPSQFVPKLQRSLGGSAGWSGFVVQLLFVAVLAWLAYEIVANARANLQAQQITAGFGFLANTAGFDINQSLISYTRSDTYGRVFVVGLLNTLLVSVIGIFFATIIGFMVALGRLSPNWLLSRISGGYVELVRNLPLLFQMLFWYLAVLAALPNPRQSISIFDDIFLNNRGLVVPRPIGTAGFEPFAVAVLIAVVVSILLSRYSRQQLFQSGRVIKVWPYVVGLLIGLPLLSAAIFGLPVVFEVPVLKGFNFSGGSRVIPELVALGAGAVDLYRSLHRRDRARRYFVRPQGADGSRLLARTATRLGAAADRDPAGDARDPAAAHQPISQCDQELLAGGGDRLSRSGLGICRHGAEPDRAGD